MNSGSPPSVLLLDGEEIPRLRTALRALQMRPVPLPAEPGDEVRADLLIATGNGLRDLPPERLTRADALPDVWVMILAEGAELAHPTLTESCFDFVIRSPIDDVAMRTLLRHLCYRGPERRREPRAAVGKRVTFLLDARPRPATLIDLSRGGCRLLVAPDARGFVAEVPPGRPIRICLGEAITGGDTAALGGRVVRSRPGDGRRHREISVAFETPEIHTAQLLRAAIERSANDAAPMERLGRMLGGDFTSAPEAPSPGERRTAPRRHYDRPVVALGRGVRVLAGIDLSPGGVRVLAEPRPALGDHLELAVYGRRGEVPLVLSAVAAADYGDHGTLLRFEHLSDAEAARLAEIAARLPELGSDDDEEHCILLTQAID